MIIRHACGHEAEYVGSITYDAREFCSNCKNLYALMEAPLGHTALALGCAMARSFIHSDAGVKKWAAKSVELARALLAELDEAAKGGDAV